MGNHVEAFGRWLVMLQPAFKTEQGPGHREQHRCMEKAGRTRGARVAQVQKEHPGRKSSPEVCMICNDEIMCLVCLSFFLTLPSPLFFHLSLAGFNLVFYSKQIYLSVQLKIVDRHFGLLRHLPLNKENKKRVSDKNLSHLRFLHGIEEELQ